MFYITFHKYGACTSMCPPLFTKEELGGNVHVFGHWLWHGRRNNPLSACSSFHQRPSSYLLSGSYYISCFTLFFNGCVQGTASAGLNEKPIS